MCQDPGALEIWGKGLAWNSAVCLPWTWWRLLSLVPKSYVNIGLGAAATFNAPRDYPCRRLWFDLSEAAEVQKELATFRRLTKKVWSYSKPGCRPRGLRV